MSISISTPIRLLAIFTMLAFSLTATVPYYCSTGWCCTQHSESEVSDAPSCCASESNETVEQAADNFGSESSTASRDNSCDTGCPTGCCKIAAHSFVFSPLLSVSSLYPLATLTPQSAQDTGVELADYIPQPPRVLTA